MNTLTILNRAARSCARFLPNADRSTFRSDEQRKAVMAKLRGGWSRIAHTAADMGRMPDPATYLDRLEAEQRGRDAFVRGTLSLTPVGAGIAIDDMVHARRPSDLALASLGATPMARLKLLDKAWDLQVHKMGKKLGITDAALATPKSKTVLDRITRDIQTRWYTASGHNKARQLAQEAGIIRTAPATQPTTVRELRDALYAAQLNRDKKAVRDLTDRLIDLEPLGNRLPPTNDPNERRRRAYWARMRGGGGTVRSKTASIDPSSRLAALGPRFSVSGLPAQTQQQAQAHARGVIRAATAAQRGAEDIARDQAIRARAPTSSLDAPPTSVDSTQWNPNPNDRPAYDYRRAGAPSQEQVAALLYSPFFNTYMEGNSRERQAPPELQPALDALRAYGTLDREWLAHWFGLAPRPTGQPPPTIPLARKQNLIPEDGTAGRKARLLISHGGVYDTLASAARTVFAAEDRRPRM